MSQNILFLCFYMLSLTGWSQGIVFEPSFNDLFEKAALENKHVFIEYYNSDCPVCKKLEVFFSDKGIAAFYNKHFISYKMNTLDGLSETEEALLEKNKLYFESVPMLVFFDAAGKYIHHSGTQLDTDFLIHTAQTALNTENRNANLADKYNQGDRTIRTLYAYADLLKLNKNEELLKEVTNDLFLVFPKDQLSSKKSYTILKNVINSTENGFFIHWINHLDLLESFETGYKEGQEKEALEKILLKELASSERYKWNEEKKTNIRKYILMLEITSNPDLFFE